MSIVILKWNPAFSSYTMARFLNDLEKCALANDGNADMNWSIWEADKVHEGDTCFLLKVGYGQTGIVARGKITSEPYSGEDWSWRNRPTKYCDFNFDAMINPDAFPILTSQELERAIPGFDWYGGHSGLVLTDNQEIELKRLWEAYMESQSEHFEKASDQNLFILNEQATLSDNPYSLELDSDYRGHYVRIKSRDSEITTEITVYNYHRVLGKLGVKSWRTLQNLIYQTYPSVNDLQNLCATLFRCQIEFNAEFYKNPVQEKEDEED